MGMPEKIARIRWGFHSSMLSVNNILYQLKLLDGNRADERNKHHFYEAMDAFQSLSRKDQKEIQKKGLGLK